MNSEELERSLRSEFETYLNGILADLRQESVEFQDRIQAEFDRHRAEFDEAFRSLAARFDSTPGFNEAFNSSVAEHLKLARDEGAKIAANAMVEAEKFDDKPALAARYDSIRDAVNDISSQDSQSAILKSLVQHAGEFAPRGAFFIIKSGHFAGWKVLGKDEEMEKTVREIHFPVSQDTILRNAIESLSTVDGHSGKFSDDNLFLDPLSFGQPQQMIALPLVARGRGVAVLYVDGGDSGGEINREALETLVKVAGITVELLASTQTAAEENRTMGAADFENTGYDREEGSQSTQQASPEAFSAPPPQFEQPSSDVASGFSFTESSSAEPDQTESFSAPAPEYGTSFQDYNTEAPAVADDSASQFESTLPIIDDYEKPAFTQDFEQPAPASPYQDSSFESQEQPEAEPQMDYSFGTPAPAVDQYQSGASEFQASESSEFQAAAPEYSPAPETSEPEHFESPVVESPVSSEPPSFGESPFDRAVEQYQGAGASSGAAYTPAPEPVVPAPATSAPQARLSDRPVDLPIDVPEDERRLHNDARRFARLLVSEIKLYNEKKVLEGKQSHDLYNRLREAIDRSREMYDKRVQPPVASKFDYFHYELLNSLADGSVERLGEGYPGASV